MALGWLLMALAEWAAWRGRPHYGSGLPPRYYIPQVSLPPPQPQAVAVAEEEPREEDEPEPEEPVEQERVEEDPGPDARPQAVAVAEEEPREEDEPEPEEPVGAPRRRRLWGRRGDDDDGADPWAVAELPPAGEGAALALPVAT